MDLINSYSDGNCGESSDEESTNADNCQRNNGPDNKLCERKDEENTILDRIQSESSAVCNSVDDDTALNTEACDFFGFSLFKQEKTTHYSDGDNYTIDIGTVGKVEVPKSEFWSGFIPDEDDISGSSSVQTSHEVYYKRQTEIDHEHGAERSTMTEIAHRHTPKRSTGTDGKNIPNFKISSHSLKEKRNVTHPYFNNASGKGVSTNSPQAIPASKKIFYVHSKVAPYLHGDIRSKPASSPQSSWPSHDGAVNRIHWNQSNFSHLLVSAGMDSMVRVWSVWSSTDKCAATLDNHTKAIKHVDWCQNGRSVFSCSYDRTALITDVECGQVKSQMDHTGFVTVGAKHSSNPQILATGTENMAFAWDCRAPQAPVKHFTYKEAFGQIQDLLYINDGREIVCCADCVSRDSADRSILVWDVRSAAVLSNQIYQERYSCTRLKLHKEKNYFLAQSHGGYIALFSTSSPYKMNKNKRFGFHKLLGYSIGFDTSEDGNLVYSGSAEGGVHCYDHRTSRLIRRLEEQGRRDVIMDVACHPVLSSVVATCTWGGSVRVWQ